MRSSCLTLLGIVALTLSFAVSGCEDKEQDIEGADIQKCHDRRTPTSCKVCCEAEGAQEHLFQTGGKGEYMCECVPLLK